MRPLGETLAQHGIRLTKSLGQHFLVSPTVIGKIVKAAQGFSVLEVGPGAGALTGPLSELGRVVAVEKDRRMADVLVETAPNADVVQADALQVDLGQLIAGLDEPRAIVSNMPYNITGPLLDRFTSVAAQVERLVLMMQKEVADKIQARVGDRRRGALSVTMQRRFDVSTVCQVPPGAFLPPPKVASTVLLFVPRPDFCEEDETVLSVVRAGFTSPRKTVANNLRTGWSVETVAQALEAAGLSPTVRAHEVDWDGWVRLSRGLR